MCLLLQFTPASDCCFHSFRCFPSYRFLPHLHVQAWCLEDADLKLGESGRNGNNASQQAMELIETPHFHFLSLLITKAFLDTVTEVLWH